MPLYTVYILTMKNWPLGEILCDLWLSLDYTACLCSIYTVFCITVDRFCSIRLPASYRVWRTKRKIRVFIWTVRDIVLQRRACMAYSDVILNYGRLPHGRTNLLLELLLWIYGSCLVGVQGIMVHHGWADDKLKDTSWGRGRLQYIYEIFTYICTSAFGFRLMMYRACCASEGLLVKFIEYRQ